MAELSLTCPKCRGSVSVPIEEGANDFTCPHCQESSPIQQSWDAFTSEMKDPLIGAVISECEVEAKVGEGGFGAVYRAFDRNLQRHVALKVMLQSLTSNLEFVQKFIREAVTAAQLNHPNIVAIHKVGRDEDRNVHFLIMEFLEGKTLSEVIDEKGALGLDETISIILQCADALAVAHDKKIVHRDIKPENIMIDRHGVVKITDFGLAKTVTTDMKSTKVVGTPHYMSPEQFEGKPVDGRTDIYSLGITFYYMLTKAKPYEGTNTVQIIYSILTQEPKAVTEMNPDVPDEVWRILRKMIHKSLDERYADFREVRRDLLAFQERSLTQKVTCPQCQAVNVRGRKFCRECGSSLMVSCPKCGHEDMAGTRHCGECGANIEGLEKIRENLDRGEKLRGFGDLKRALAFYQEVLKLDPEHEEATRATTEIHQELHRIEEQKAKIDSLVKEGNADQALRAVEDLLQNYPKVDEVKTYGQTVRRSLRLRAVDAHLLVAEKALSEGRLEDALAAYGKALEVDPDRPEIREKKEDLERRIAAFEKTLQTAEGAISKGRHVEALNAAKELLRLKPDHDRAREIHDEAKGKVESIESFVQEARRLLDEKEYEEALSRLETAHEISPGDEEVAALLDHARKGKARLEEKLALVRRLLAEEKPADALAGAEEVLAEKPGHAGAAALLEEAKADLERKRHREEIEGLFARAKKLEKEGRSDGALAVLLEILEKDPENEKAETERVRIEARMQEIERLSRRADEYEKEGNYPQAVAVLNQLREHLPADEALAARAEKARQSMERIDAGLARAADANRRKRYDLAVKAADEVLAIAPGNGQAIAAKREAERGREAIEAHLAEARSLIDSELFDDAIAELNKAAEKGAPAAEVSELRKAAEEGRVMLLKSEATRSFVFKDFKAAIERYEQVLSVEGDDADAKKGIRLAEKMIRAREREGVVGKVLAAGLLVAGLVVVQYLAVGAGGKTAVATSGPPVPVVEVPDRPEPPTPEKLSAIEAGGGLDPASWQAIGARYSEWKENFPDVEEIASGERFSRDMQAALAIPLDRPRERLDALRRARDEVGKIRVLRDPRNEVLDRAIAKTVEKWAQDTYDAEGRDWQADVERYQQILDDPAVAGTPLAATVQSYRQFALQMAAARLQLDGGQYHGALEAFETAAANASGNDAQSRDRRGKAMRGVEQVKAAWIGAVRSRLEELAKDPDADPERIYRELVTEMATMAKNLKMDREELYREITGR